MTDLFDELEQSLLATGAVRDDLCRRAAQEAPAGIQPALAFLGCATGPMAPQTAPVPVEDRVRAGRLMLLRLRASTGDPRWSSAVLDQLVTAALALPGAAATDVLHALFDLLADRDGDVTGPEAHLIKDLTVQVFTRRRRSYASEDFSWLTDPLHDDARCVSPAQAYMAVLALPEAEMASCKDRVLRVLQGSVRFDEAAAALQ